MSTTTIVTEQHPEVGQIICHGKRACEEIIAVEGGLVTTKPLGFWASIFHDCVAEQGGYCG